MRRAAGGEALPSHADILAAIAESRRAIEANHAAMEAVTARVEALWERSKDRDARLDVHGDLLERLTAILEAWDTGKRTGQFFVSAGRVVKWAAGIIGGLAIIGAAAKYAAAHIFNGGAQP